MSKREKGIVIAVTGGRDYADWKRSESVLDELQAARKIGRVLHGGADGADLLADVWAFLRGIDRRKFPADWQKHGRAAGPIRNREMLDEGSPVLLVAFPGGRGTADCTTAARERFIDVREIPVEEEKEW